MSYATTRCEVCLYAEAVSRAAAERQVAAAEAERERAKPKKAAGAPRP